MEKKVTYASSDEGFNLLRKYLEKGQKLWDEFEMGHDDGHEHFDKESPKLMAAIRDYEDKMNYAQDKKELEDYIFRAEKNWEKVFKRRAVTKQTQKEEDMKVTASALKGVIKNYALDVKAD
jgi:hypothetical protein